MELLNGFGADPEKALNGAWVTLKDNAGETCQLLIARMDNPRYREFVINAMASRVAEKGDAELTDQEQDDIIHRALSETILLGWKDLKIGGEEVPYSAEKAYDILSHPVLVPFRERVIQESKKFSNYRAKSLDTATEKS